MFIYQEPVGEYTPEWPYPVKYGEEKEITADVLIIGGGIAGSHAALHADVPGELRSPLLHV